MARLSDPTATGFEYEYEYEYERAATRVAAIVRGHVKAGLSGSSAASSTIAAT